MKEREELINLYLIYKELFTDKQKKYFESYYFEDLSLSEISENIGVSKTIIGRTLKEIIKKLNNYESILHVNDLYKKIKELESLE